ncbi:asparagine synthase (glutamine-hydrolyzing) [Actinoalloteichus hoggarensis]|uniref:asparagine synthase (glutamine-hydrolyzing) n=1 Tax=Actinoalloteichus hoggarensis TaxID=1470176 RepID=A0A221W647_9PSEU|nr:asparagine synthase (glutamine-hydrolyzing) [Actinoalloteichus hoggarensis]ASO21089.1 Asparagine synthetase [glutamine-hydrolyzing] 3 [Actinoalloteichus hoggarensis]MBB5921019.1 asparagine synthase (glutamine-hydrolyzing) [Actinoalloteichus hoggarensis]
MCGFVGWLDFARDLRGEQRILDTMTDTMEDRGPDGRGTWLGRHAALGHRRLSVIDLAGGAQPMISEVGPQRMPVVLAFAGEIYNFVELRAELIALGHEFRTRSDTEVVLHAYLEWGADCAERLNGMFAFAVWDSVLDAMVLVRDRLGVKPLYYAPTPDGVLLASEPKGILANPSFKASLTTEALPILLNSRLALPGETPISGLREVKPGHTVRIDRRGCHETPYWRLSSRPHTDDFDTTLSTIRDLLEDTVERQLVADVPRAAMLSGGLDSSVVAAMAMRRMRRDGEGPLITYSVRFEGEENDFRPTALRPERDAPYAASAARHLGTEHVEVVLTAADLAAAAPAARRARDLPSLGQFDTSMYSMFAALRERCTVALSGEAADEIFGGYPWFHASDLVWRDGFPWLGDAPRLADCLSPDLRAALRPAEFEADRYATLRSQVPRLPGEDRLNARMREVLFFSLQGPLFTLLERKDRMSMAVGLEVRVPFCDHRLLEYVWNVPWSMKAADGREKSLLRMAAADLLPPEILNRRKSAYPAMHDPRQETLARTAVRELVADSSSPLSGLLDHDRVLSLAADQHSTMTHASTAHLLTPLLEVDTWMRETGLDVT